MKITIIGIGLIGGSMAKDLKKRNFAEYIIGVEKDKKNAKAAIKLGIVDDIMPLEKAVPTSDVVIIAVPVDETLKIIRDVMDLVENQTILDVGSTKEPIIKAIETHHRRANFVATHPMAGTEYSGPEAAINNLFDNKAVIFCNTEKSDKKHLKVVEKIYNTLNMRIIKADAAIHDIHAAYVSHISHISSFALALTVLHKEHDEKSIFDMASGGFESTVRLAKSSPQMWVPIFSQNKKNILEVLDTYINFLYDFKLAIFNDDNKRLETLLKKGNFIKNILNSDKYAKK